MAFDDRIDKYLSDLPDDGMLDDEDEFNQTLDGYFIEPLDKEEIAKELRHSTAYHAVVNAPEDDRDLNVIAHFYAGDNSSDNPHDGPSMEISLAWIADGDILMEIDTDSMPQDIRTSIELNAASQYDDYLREKTDNDRQGSLDHWRNRQRGY